MNMATAIITESEDDVNGMIDFPQQKYKTIYIDPPWPERGGGRIKRGADRHYSLMSLDDIKKLPVQDLADEDGCHIYLWATNNFLQAGLDCLNAWGFNMSPR